MKILPPPVSVQSIRSLQAEKSMRDVAARAMILGRERLLVEFAHVTEFTPDMKMMGSYKSQAAAEKAMHGMKACKA
jgi:hypothetical protein